MAGVFTRSLTASAPVLWCRKVVAGGRGRVVVCNSGNANAFTGSVGEAAVRRTVDRAATVMGCTPEEVLVASTGTIGQPLPDHKITENLAAAAARLDAGRGPTRRAPS